jgi:hypothetical protein
MPPLFPNATSPELIYPTLPGNCILLPTVILLLKYAFPVVVPRQINVVLFFCGYLDGEILRPECAYGA